LRHRPGQPLHLLAVKINPGNCVAIVTGAASGIGRALSLQLAEKGCDLALVDVNEAGLSETAAQVKKFGRLISLHNINVAERSAMARLPEAVLSHHRGVHVLINNAGVSLAGPFESCSLEDVDWIFGINFWGVVFGCKFFLPLLQREKESHIVNVASEFGLIGCPTKTAYCATKFAVRGFSEALRAELFGSTVKLTCVYPGPVNTGIAHNGRAWNGTKQKLEADFLATRGLSAEKVAHKIIRAVERNRPRVLIGSDTRMVDAFTRLAPVLANSLIGRFRSRFPFL
jgi:short-subunit dehydrogenase